MPKEYKESCFPKRSMLFCRGVFGALMNGKQAAVNKLTAPHFTSQIQNSRQSVNKMQLHPMFPDIYFRKTDCSFIEFNKTQKYFNEIKYLLEILF